MVRDLDVYDVVGHTDGAGHRHLGAYHLQSCEVCANALKPITDRLDKLEAALARAAKRSKAAKPAPKKRRA